MMTIMSKISSSSSSSSFSSTYKKTASILVNSFLPNINSDNKLNIISNNNSGNLNIAVSTLHHVPPYFNPTTTLPSPVPSSSTTIANLDNPTYSGKIITNEKNEIHLDHNEYEESNDNDTALKNLSVWLISTLKRRKKKMNKHKLRKRRKLLRLKSKK